MVSIARFLTYLMKLTITLRNLDVKGILELINEFRDQPTY